MLKWKFIKSDILSSEYDLKCYEKLVDLNFVQKHKKERKSVNFNIKFDFLLKSALEKYALGQPEFHEKPKKSILLEYSQPNICKIFHIGHLRNLLIGDALQRIYRATGHDVVAINYPGDMGTHVATSIWKILRDFEFLRKEKDLEGQLLKIVEKSGKSIIQWLSDVYSSGVQLRKGDYERVTPEIKKILTMLEEKTDPNINQIFYLLRKWSLDDFENIYRYFGVEFDEFMFESEDPILSLESIYKRYNSEKSPLVDSDGTIGLKNPELGYFMLITSNKNSLYAAKDINLFEEKRRRWPNHDENIYLVDKRQVNYFKQVFRTIREFNIPDIEKARHIPHGLVNLADGKTMSSRNNDFVDFWDLKKELEEKIVEKKGVDFPKEMVKIFTIGVIKFEMLQKNMEKDINFDQKKILDLKTSGFFILDTYYQFLKNPKEEKKKSGSPNHNKFDRKCLTLLLVLEDVVTRKKPSLLCLYLYHVARLSRKIQNEQVKKLSKLVMEYIFKIIGIPLI